MFESLEIRVLLSAAFDPKTGLLKVTGTPQVDTIRLTQTGQVLTLLDAGKTSTFDASKVKQITVQGLGGNDSIALRGPSGAGYRRPGRSAGSTTSASRWTYSGPSGRTAGSRSATSACRMPAPAR